MDKHARVTRPCTACHRRWAKYTAETVAFTLAQLPQLPAGSRVLDLACGTGAVLRALDAGRQPRLAEYVGLDNSSEMIRRAECACASSPTPQRWVHAPADEPPLPLPDGAFDAVITANSFHFFGDPAASLREAARALRPGGYLLVGDWSADYLTCRALELWLRLTGRPTSPVLRAAGLRALVEATPGLEVERESSGLLLWYWGFMALLARKAAS